MGLAWGRYTPAQRVEMIVKVYDPAGTTASDLVVRLRNEFGILCTRNAVIGTYNRIEKLKIDHPLTGVTQGAARNMRSEESKRFEQEAKAKRSYDSSARREVAARNLLLRKREREERTEDVEARQTRINLKRTNIANWEKKNSLHISLIELEPGLCKWPVNDGGPYLFCGRDDRSEKSSYCCYHHRLVYDPTNDGAGNAQGSDRTSR